MSEHAAEEAFWSAIDDGQSEVERDREWWRDYYGDAERMWRQ